MEINLENPKEVVLVKEVTKKIEKITILRMVDIPKEKKVFVMTQELGQIVLWEGEDYDIIGQWSDQDVINRIKDLYS